MNSTKRLMRLLLTVGALSVAAAAAFAPASLAATGDCGARALSQPYAAFGDSNSYFLAPGGSFDQGAPGWLLQGAAVEQGALHISGAATSSAFCVTQSDVLVRFSAKSVQNVGSYGNWSQLNVYAILRNASGSQMTSYLGALQAGGYGNWAFSPQLTWGAQWASWLFTGDGTATMQLLFTVQGQGGTWLLDDVYVDPVMGR